MAFAAHILTSGSVGMIASPGGGSELSADSCFFAAEDTVKTLDNQRNNWFKFLNTDAMLCFNYSYCKP